MPVPDSRLPRADKPALPRRFFTHAAVHEAPDGFRLVLDGRSARTPGRRELTLPTRAAAEAVAAEWNQLGEWVDPTRLPLTRIVNSVLDGVAEDMAAVEAELTRYFRSDLLFYRAEGPAALVAEQARQWDPILDWAHDTFQVRPMLAEGVVFVAQPDIVLRRLDAAVRAAVGSDSGAAFRLAALQVMTGLTGSGLLALAVAAKRIDAGAAWRAAHVDETFQESQWGEDAEALERREARWVEMSTAADLLDRIGPPSA